MLMVQEIKTNKIEKTEKSINHSLTHSFKTILDSFFGFFNFRKEEVKV